MHRSAIAIGWSFRDITPPLPACLAGQFDLRRAESIRDPLTLTALALDSGDDCVVHISCDLISSGGKLPQRIRELLQASRPDFPTEKVIVNATHTHTAPYLKAIWHRLPEDVLSPEACLELVAAKATEAALEAWHSRRPGSIAYGSDFAVLAHQRRIVYFGDAPGAPGAPGMCIQSSAAMYGKVDMPNFAGYEGYADHRTDFIYTFDEKDKLTGIVAALPATAQVTEGLHEVSADYWHETRLAVARKFGPQVRLLPLCTAAGDLSPHLWLQTKAEERMLALAGHDLRTELAERLVNAMDHTLAVCGKEKIASPVLRHCAATVVLPARRVTDSEAGLMRQGIAELEAMPVQDDVYFRTRQEARILRCRTVLERYERQQSGRDLAHEEEFHALRLDALALVTTPHELFLDFALEIQGRSPALSTIVVQLAGGGPDDYVPTARAEAGGSYSACVYCNSVGSDGGRHLVEHSLKALNPLFA